MDHWSEGYLNQPYIPEIADCMTLAERVAVEVLGIHPGLPVSHETSLRKQAEQINALKDTYAVRVDRPIDGHPVLFRARGKFYHCGVIALMGGQTLVLHNSQSFGAVIRQPLADVTRWEYKLEGFYSWIASK